MKKRQSGKALVSSMMADEYILNYMKKHNITQNDLEKSIGIKQSRISKIKNEGSAHFDFEDISNFAIEYEQSIDEMIDLAGRSESAPKREKTFKDILSRLFYIERETRYADGIDFELMGQGDTRKVVIQFESANLVSIIDQWAAANSISTKNKSGQRVTDIVKNALLEDASLYKQQHNFMSDISYTVEIYRRARQTLHYDDEDVKEFNIRVPYDEETGQVEPLYFRFTQKDYEFFKDMALNKRVLILYEDIDYLITQIDTLIDEKAALFMPDIDIYDTD